MGNSTLRTKLMGWRMGESQGKEEGKSATIEHRRILSVVINQQLFKKLIIYNKCPCGFLKLLTVTNFVNHYLTCHFMTSD